MGGRVWGGGYRQVRIRQRFDAVEQDVFTGLVQAVGKVTQVESVAAGVRFRVDPAGWSHEPADGDSISVNGVCLTVARRPAEIGGGLEFVAVPETLARTTLGGLRAGSRVNLEHALRADSLLGGHVVQGHVDGVGVVERIQRDDGWRIRVRVMEHGDPARAETWQQSIVPKGSVAVEGVSLTVAAAGGREGWLEVALIPTTLERTTLGGLREGDRVNIESDIQAKTAVYWLREWGAGR